jgi:uncharacterized protein with NRDE domain
MCTLALYTRVGTELPLLIAANRDEFLDRPTAGPRVLSVDPWVFGGQDLDAGGTWLGLNEHGLLVALLNRRSSQPPDPSLQSRGLLCLRALQCRNVAGVLRLFRDEDVGDYNPFTLMAATRESAVVFAARNANLEVTHLDPGLHLLTNLNVDDPDCPRIARSRSRFAAIRPCGLDRSGAFLAPLRAILADHQAPGSGPVDEGSLCIHRGPYGTRSSTIIGLDSIGRAGYWHAEGPPCRTDHEPIALPGPTATTAVA